MVGEVLNNLIGIGVAGGLAGCAIFFFFSWFTAHRHAWSSWEETDRFTIQGYVLTPGAGMSTNKTETGQRGIAIIQERKCSLCGFKDIQLTEVGSARSHVADIS